MTVYYVKPTGNDSNDGLSWDTAWETVQHAADTATAGDTVTFADGTYACNSVTFGTHSGSAGNEIVFCAQNRRGATWKRTTQNNTINITKSYLRFEGIVIEGSTTLSGTNVRMSSVNHITFYDCEIKNSYGRGVWATNCTDIVFEDCEVHNETQYPTAPAVDGFQIDGSSTANWTITGCVIYHTQHNGIAMYAANGAVISDCTFYETGSHAISVGDPDGVLDCYNVLVEGNVVHHSGQWGPDSVNDPKRGIYVQWTARTVTVRRNVVYRCNGPGISVRSNCIGPIDVYNNTFYRNDKVQEGWGSVFLDDFGEENDPVIRFKNNIVVHDETTRTYLWESATCTNVDADYNALYDISGTEDVYRGTSYGTYAAYQSAGHEPHSVVSQNPLLNDPENGDFTLQSGSPCIDAGVDVGEDYNGEAPDIGAYEYGGSTSNIAVLRRRRE